MDFTGDFSELVCENGRIVLRGRSTTPSSISCSSNYDKTNANFSGLQDTNTRKRSRLSWVKNYESCAADDYHPEFTRFMEISTDHNSDINYIVEPQTVPVCHDENLTRRVYESDVEAPQLMKARSDQLHNQGYLQQCQVGLSTVARFPESDLQMLNSSEPDKQFGLGNMPLFSAAENVLPKTNSEQNGVPNSSKVGNDALAPSLLAGCQYPRPSKVEQIREVTSFPKEQVPDEHSEAPPYINDIKNKRVFYQTTSLQPKTVGRKLPDAAASSRSLGSSNDPMPKDVDEAVRAGFKKRRTPEVHNQSERKRRSKINKKLRALQALLPNSDKADKASMLDNAIEYLKSLQLQLQIMSAGSSTSMPPVMMPTMLPQMQLMGLGMGMRMPIGPLPFMNSGMLGPAAVLPLPVMSQPTFIPFIGAARNSSTSSVPPFSGAVASAPADVMGSAASLLSSVQKSFQATRQSPSH